MKNYNYTFFPKSFSLTWHRHIGQLHVYYLSYTPIHTDLYGVYLVTLCNLRVKLTIALTVCRIPSHLQCLHPASGWAKLCLASPLPQWQPGHPASRARAYPHSAITAASSPLAVTSAKTAMCRRVSYRTVYRLHTGQGGEESYTGDVCLLAVGAEQHTHTQTDWHTKGGDSHNTSVQSLIGYYSVGLPPWASWTMKLCRPIILLKSLQRHTHNSND